MSLILSGTDGLSDVDGTAATPAIRGTDTNTGIFFPAADTVAASVGGTEGLRLTSTGLTTQQDATVYGVRVGRGAGAVSTNTAVGASALLSNTTGARNTAIGFQSLDLVTTGGNNTAVGYNTLTTLTTGAGNTAVGESALEVTTSSFNSAVGKDTLASNSTGANNTAMGYQALLFNTTASFNTAVGYQAAYSNATSSYNTAIGHQAMFSSTGGTNLGVGTQALYANTTGDDNTAIGSYRPLYSNTTGLANVAVGRAALFSNTTGSYNVAVGRDALQANTTASSNTAVGYQAAYSNQTGAITAFGYQAGQSYNTNGTETWGSQFMGALAGVQTTTGVNNLAIGPYVFRLNTTGSNNVAVGPAALYSNTTASNNTAVGYQAGYSNTTGTRHTMLGTQAGYSTNGGDPSNGALVAVGYQAGYTYAVTGVGSEFYGTTIIGSYAGYSVNSANNTALGGFALYSAAGANNTAIGAGALFNNTGTFNTAIGRGAGAAITSGTKNTTLGAYNGNQSGLDIRTASNYIVLSDGDGNPRYAVSPPVGYGSQAPNHYLRGSLLWGANINDIGTLCAKATSSDNGIQVTIQARIATATNEWQGGFVMIRASCINADASGGACAWWILGYRAFNGAIAFFGVADSGGNTGSFTLSCGDATSGTTAYAQAQVRVTSGNNRTTMDAEFIAYNYILSATRA